MESTSERVFYTEGEDAMFRMFATSGKWMYFLGILGIPATLILLFQGISSDDGLFLLLLIGASTLAGFISLELILYGTAVRNAARSRNIAQLTTAGRHLRNAAMTLGFGAIGVVAFVIAFLLWLMFFGGFHR